MKLHEFYQKYANIPLSGENSRFLKRRYLDWNKSPDDLYCEIKKYTQEIDELQKTIETLLIIADKILI